MALHNTKKRLIAALIVNCFIVVMEIIGLYLSIVNHGIALFEFYTQDSNIFAMFASAVFVVYAINALKSGTMVLPQWVITLKYMATCCLAVTFVVVICILSPMSGAGGYKLMLLYGSMLYHHFLCPVAALISFIFLEGSPSLNRKHTYAAMIPTLIYAVVAIALNIAKLLEGPYPFLLVYEQPVYMSAIWTIVIIGLAYLLAWLIRQANRICSCHYTKNLTGSYS